MPSPVLKSPPDLSAEKRQSELQMLRLSAQLQWKCCMEAWRDERWTAALEHHDGLFAAVQQLVAARPAEAPGLWGNYGEALAQFTAAVHPLVVNSCTEPPPLVLRAELVWALAQRLQQAGSLPIAAPHWLAVLEQQLVQDGAGHWQALALEGGSTALVARQRSLRLLQRLEQLLDVVPEWVPSQIAALAEALANVPADSATEPVSALPAADVAQLVLLEVGAEATLLQFDLRSLLEGRATSLEEAMDDFVWHLPKGCLAEPASVGLQQALEPQWQLGLRLDNAAFEQLAQLAVLWQRRLGPRMLSLQSLDWRHGLVVELSATELEVLRPLMADPQSLEPVLAELRRQHQNQGFWQRQEELPWMVCPPPLEALRRLHVHEGYVASSHEPLPALQQWGQQAVRALLEAELWTNDAGCLGRWLALAQELVGQGVGPLPPLGVPPAADHLLSVLGGHEVIYVGDEAAAVQQAHRAGRCFRGEPFGLRVVPMPESRWPARPAGGFMACLAALLETIDGLYRQRPFAILLADCGAYRLPLLRAVHQRYGVPGLSSDRPMARWLAA